MKQNSRLQKAARTGLAAIGLALVSGGFSHFALGQEAHPPKEDLPAKELEYSPYPDQHFPNRVLWGDTHHHFNFSFDDGFTGTKLGPDDSFRFARGEELLSNTGLRARLNRPLDFLVVSDHAEYMGLADLLLKADPAMLATPNGKRWYEGIMAGGEKAMLAVIEVSQGLVKPGAGAGAEMDDKIRRSVWERVTAIATKYNEPGKFTAFNGFEWTSFPGQTTFIAS